MLQQVGYTRLAVTSPAMTAKCLLMDSARIRRLALTNFRSYRALINLGLTDALRAVSDASDLYTFWDYQAGAWEKDNGIRIDHVLLSPQAADKLAGAGIDRHVRGWDKPSDHVPVYVDLDIEGR